MITDWETNKIYYSYLSNYDFKLELKKLKKIIKNYGFKHHHIAGTIEVKNVKKNIHNSNQ